MKIYLADLCHTGKGRSPNSIPLGVGYLASFLKKNITNIEIIIFTDPNFFLKQVKIKPPDIVGFTVKTWSEQLSSFCAKRIKKWNNKTIIIAGGSSIDDIDTEIQNFLQKNRYYDVCVPNEGDVPFFNIVTHVEKYGKIVKEFIIEGAAQIGEDGAIFRGEIKPPVLNDIPSPYLDRS